MPPDNYYRICALPVLGDLGTPVPIAPAGLLAHVAEAARPRTLVEAVLLFDDLVQREAFLAGEVREVTPAVLSAAQIRNEEPLPEPLAAEASPPPRVAADAVWSAYFRHAAGVARREGSPLLAAWVAHEVTLRNALASARAQALGLEAGPYLVTAELGGAEEDFSPLVSEWAAAPDPLAGLRVLDRARWAWLAEHDRWFTFADEEFVAYAARLMLIVRWHRLSAAPV
ncbi:MAG: hypothetical protein FJ288_05070 [Planctomycetes bacterium]|nr:hypothetical protein [Planctomycetota bacterium]